ncbi:hypothetical protein AX774_g748 [Zancudomyces culisetae]|uniref:Uncharacterized protein n=1 Tax=Zancudomyces culisetae TaxID=1213189 RepID=A0A1R1PXQ5_ZANCU|nr:hypothetical protein AX774_g748 [Zancudomyces culisetae]|eukprot:OMH85697.1 hypothetical protein AX774_g748 [Zancudomyces culisetae]
MLFIAPFPTLGVIISTSFPSPSIPIPTPTPIVTPNPPLPASPGVPCLFGVICIPALYSFSYTVSYFSPPSRCIIVVYRLFPVLLPLLSAATPAPPLPFCVTSSAVASALYLCELGLIIDASSRCPVGV